MGGTWRCRFPAVAEPDKDSSISVLDHPQTPSALRPLHGPGSRGRRRSGLQADNGRQTARRTPTTAHKGLWEDNGRRSVATFARTALARYGITSLASLHRKLLHVTFPSAHNRTTLCPALNLISTFISLHLFLQTLIICPSPLLSTVSPPRVVPSAAALTFVLVAARPLHHLYHPPTTL